MNIILNFVSIEESGSFFINLAKLEKLTFATRSNEVICPFFQKCGDPGTFVRHDIYKVSPYGEQVFQLLINTIIKVAIIFIFIGFEIWTERCWKSFESAGGTVSSSTVRRVCEKI